MLFMILTVSHLPSSDRSLSYSSLSDYALFSIPRTSLVAWRCTLSIFSVFLVYWMNNCHAILHFSPQHKHWPTGPAHFSDRRASTLYLSLARQDHRVKCRASRLKIMVARSMTNFATFSCILFLKFRYVCIA